MPITMTIKKGSGSGNFKPGWSEVTVTSAKYGSLDNGFNIYLYKNSDGYYRVLQRIAPVVGQNALDTFTENDVEYWKGRAEQYFKEWVEPNIGSSVADKTEGDMPF